jgi:thiamine-monophosphate kinase
MISLSIIACTSLIISAKLIQITLGTSILRFFVGDVFRRVKMKDEFSFISSITPKQIHQPSLNVGIGDDAAIYSGSTQYDEVVCVDTMVEGVHFTKNTLSPYQIGKKALAVNLSDLAAMGAIPHYFLVSIAISPQWTEEELEAVYKGMNDLANKYQTDLIGGDTVSTKEGLVITVTVIGRVEARRRLLRSNAQIGDTVFLTGYVGGSAAGLALLLEYGRKADFSKEEEKLTLAHQEPQPQIEAGRILAQSNFRLSLNDVSDGVASEANEIAEASQVKLTIDPDKLPYHPFLNNRLVSKKLDFALYGGEDFQLIGTVACEHFEALKKKCSESDILLTSIGEVDEGEGSVYLKRADEQIKLLKKGYNHFSK